MGGMRDRMGNDFVREECTQGRVDGCREGADESHEVIERCCGFVLSCFVLQNYAVVRTARHRILFWKDRRVNKREY